MEAKTENPMKNNRQLILFEAGKGKEEDTREEIIFTARFRSSVL